MIILNYAVVKVLYDNLIFRIRKNIKYTISGDNRAKVHLFSFRTQKLSFAGSKILGWRRPGKIGHCQKTRRRTTKVVLFFLLFNKT